MKKQIPWKFLPLVLLILFIPAIPAIVMRHNTREQAQAAVQVNETELRQVIVDGMVEGGFTQADGHCVANLVVWYHGAEGAAKLMREGDDYHLYHPISDKMLAECQVKYTH